MLSSVSGADTPKASSLLSLCQQLGGSLATAFLVTLIDRRTAFHQSILAAHATLSVPAVAAMSAGQIGNLYGIIVREASTLAFAAAFLAAAVLPTFSPPFIFLLRAKRAARPASVAIE